MSTETDRTELLETYVNGNISDAHEGLQNRQDLTFAELFDMYVALYAPTADELSLFVHRMT